MIFSVSVLQLRVALCNLLADVFLFLCLDVTHGATITIPVTADSSETFEVLTTMQSRKVAKEEASRRALRSGIAERLESAFKARLVVDSGGYLTFNGGESDAAGLDPAASLAKEVKELMGSDKSLVWTPKSSLITKGELSAQYYRLCRI